MYNASTALRQSLVQTYASFLFNLPLALVFSPAQFAVHTQLNLLFQFWIHTGEQRSATYGHEKEKKLIHSDPHLFLPFVFIC